MNKGKRLHLLVLQCFLMIGLVGCSTYQGERYIHEPTSVFSYSMVVGNFKRASRIVRKTTHDIIVIQRFREFSKDFSTNYAYVYFVS